MGDIARQATHQVIRKAAGGDPVWEVGIEEKVKKLRADLLGPNPSPLDLILVRRVLNCWILTNALEVEQAVRPPSDPKAGDHLDRQLSRAQRRLTEAVKTLAVVRRLQAPAVVAQLNIAGNQIVANLGVPQLPTPDKT